MNAPTWDQFMKPLLEALAAQSPLTLRELYDAVAKISDLTDEMKQEVVPSGQARYKDRISWAATYLAQANAVERPKRGIYVLTQRGRDLLAESGPISVQRLQEFPEFVEFMTRSKPNAPKNLSEQESSPDSPQEVIEAAANELRAVVEAELLQQLQTMDPLAFERLVLKVLRGIGYGINGSLETTKTSGDNGIDGIISQDPLGLDRIYVQAKRYKVGVTVGGPDMQTFIGALAMQQGDRGIFITSSSFTKSARESVKMAHARIELIDGPRLARLMIDHGIGVQTAFTTTGYKLDNDFFEDL